MITMTEAEKQKDWHDREVARTTEAEKSICSAHNWERVCKEQPRTVLSPPQAAAVRAKKGAEETGGGETTGQKVLRLWELRGIKAEKLDH